MQPKFNDKWEHTDGLFQKSYRNDFCTLQFHSQIEIYFIDEGEMEISVGNQKNLLQEGQLSVALSYEPHFYKTLRASRSSVLIVPLHLCERFLSTTKGLHPISPFITERAVYEELKQYYELLKAAEGQHLLQYGYLQVILGIITATLPFEPADEPLDPDLATALLSYINQHFKRGLTPCEVAAALGYSPAYLSRLFRARFGITMIQYITNIKLKNTLTLLLEEKGSITDCALESGFSSFSSFYRAFHKEFHCSPGEYLKQIRKN